MKWKYFTLFILLASIINPIGLFSQNVELTTQAEVDAFTGTKIDGFLLIRSNGITDLNKLSTLDTVTGSVFIEYNRKLRDLDGLDSILHIGGTLLIEANTELDSINAFGLLKYVGGPLVLRGNAVLKDCCAFYPLISGTQGVIRGGNFISGNKGCTSEKELRENCDTDSDKDGKDDTEDGCPNDPNKIQPGICGCGVAETDSDNDGTPDCKDQCPNDPNKVVAGNCGCGEEDRDSDNDGTPDCEDACPYNAELTEMGICGCEDPGIVGISIANIGTCDDRGTATSADDTYPVDVTITFERAPTSGKVLITGGTNAELNFSAYSTATSYTLFDLPFTANGKLIEVIATFVGNSNCTKRRVYGIRAPESCSTGACDPPNNSTVDTENYLNAALLSWIDAGVGVEYEVEYRPNGTTNWATKSVKTNQLLISDLSDYTTYDYRIKSLCENYKESAYLTGQFTTSGLECKLTKISVQNVDCQDNEAPDDTSDDYVTFDLYVEGTNVGNGFSIDNVVGENSGQYNTQNTFRTAAGSFGNGDIQVTITDKEDPTCQLSTVIVEPTSCDDDCQINFITFGKIRSCHDGGTSWTTNDDFFIADMVVNFDNPPATGHLRLQGRFFQSVAVSRLQNTNSYTFRRIVLPATGKNFELTALFTKEKTCTYTADFGGVFIEENQLCSDECSILDTQVSNVQCMDNDTPELTDDYLTFELMVRGIHLGNSYQVSNVVGTDTALYNTPTVFRTANGVNGENITVTITDSNDSNCQSIISIDANCGAGLKVNNSYNSHQVNLVRMLKLYPNPAKETLFLEYPATQTSPLVEVFDLLGQKIMSQKIEGSELNISHLQKGIYHLVFRNGTDLQTKKFIKE